MIGNMKEDLSLLEVIQGESNPGYGEDSCFAAANDHYALLSVMDGCGGLGSRKYRTYQDRTGAWMASRAVAGSLYNWFHENSALPENLRDSLSSAVQRGFQVLENHGGSSSKISGSMVRNFPTTLACAVVHPDQDGLAAEVIWAGDSRVYLLNEEGLMQLSVDDTGQTDALLSLYQDPPLENLLSANRVSLNHQKIRLIGPFLLICATDGCFAYTPSPMHFEKILLEGFAESQSLEDACQNINTRIQDLAADDYTMVMAGFGYDSWLDLKTSLQIRLRNFEERYPVEFTDDPDDQNSDAQREQLEDVWFSGYRDDYERCWRKEK